MFQSERQLQRIKKAQKQNNRRHVAIVFPNFDSTACFSDQHFERVELPTKEKFRALLAKYGLEHFAEKTHFVDKITEKDLTIAGLLDLRTNLLCDYSKAIASIPAWNSILWTTQMNLDSLIADMFSDVSAAFRDAYSAMLGDGSE